AVAPVISARWGPPTASPGRRRCRPRVQRARRPLRPQAFAAGFRATCRRPPGVAVSGVRSALLSPSALAWLLCERTPLPPRACRSDQCIEEQPLIHWRRNRRIDLPRGQDRLTLEHVGGYGDSGRRAGRCQKEAHTLIGDGSEELIAGNRAHIHPRYHGGGREPEQLPL